MIAYCYMIVHTISTKRSDKIPIKLRFDLVKNQADTLATAGGVRCFRIEVALQDIVKHLLKMPINNPGKRFDDVYSDVVVVRFR